MHQFNLELPFEAHTLTNLVGQPVTPMGREKKGFKMVNLVYHDDWIHRMMLRDTVRCGIYQAAIAERIKEGQIILDVGAGTGILSLFAAQAGAARVYAVERAMIYKQAERLARMNGKEDVITVIHGDIESVELPETVDGIVSEWMGCLGVDENILGAVLIARDRWLKPGGVILPEWVRSWLAPVYDPQLDDELIFWRNTPYGLDLSLFAESKIREPAYCQPHITKSELVAEAKPLWTVNVYDYSSLKASTPYEASLSFVTTCTGKISALVGWFDAGFGTELDLDTGPNAPDTCWGRIIFPLERAINVAKNSELIVVFRCQPVGPGYSLYRAEISLNGGPWSSSEWKFPGALQG